MQIRIRCFAILRELSVGRATVKVGDEATVADAWRALSAMHPAVEPHRATVRPARNGAYAAWDDPIHDGDEVAFLPPVSGGAGPLRLTDGPIDVDELERIADRGHGAVVTFLGRARDRADDGREVLDLEYEAYPAMAEQVLAEIAAETEVRWPGTSVAIVHRTGRVPIGEAAVAIVVAAAHRSAAYEGSRHVIEEIKSRLPIWKRERFADGTEWKRQGA